MLDGICPYYDMKQPRICQRCKVARIYSELVEHLGPLERFGSIIGPCIDDAEGYKNCERYVKVNSLEKLLEGVDFGD